MSALRATQGYHKLIAQLHENVRKIIREDLAKHKCIKAGLFLECRYHKTQPVAIKNYPNDPDEEVVAVQDAIMRTSMDRVILNETTIDTTTERMMGEIMTEVDELTY